MEKDGYLRLVQFGRIDIPASVQKAFGVYRGWPKTYAESKEMFKSIPKEARKFPFIMSGRVLVAFPNDATEEEVIKSLELLLITLRNKQNKK